MGLYSSLGLDVVMVGCKLIEMLLFLTFEHGYSYGSNDNFPFYFSYLLFFSFLTALSQPDGCFFFLIYERIVFL